MGLAQAGERAEEQAAKQVLADFTRPLVLGCLGQTEWRATDAQSGLTLAGTVTQTAPSLHQALGASELHARPGHRARDAGARAEQGPCNARQPRIVLQSVAGAMEPTNGDAARVATGGHCPRGETGRSGRACGTNNTGTTSTAGRAGGDQ